MTLPGGSAANCLDADHADSLAARRKASVESDRELQVHIPDGSQAARAVRRSGSARRDRARGARDSQAGHLDTEGQIYIEPQVHGMRAGMQAFFRMPAHDRLSEEPACGERNYEVQTCAAPGARRNESRRRVRHAAHKQAAAWRGPEN